MIELDIRARNCLRSAGFSEPFNPAEIAKLSLAELLRIPGVGRLTLINIEEWLFQNGAIPITQKLEVQRRRAERAMAKDNKKKVSAEKREARERALLAQLKEKYGE